MYFRSQIDRFADQVSNPDDAAAFRAVINTLPFNKEGKVSGGAVERIVKLLNEFRERHLEFLDAEKDLQLGTPEPENKIDPNSLITGWLRTVSDLVQLEENAATDSSNPLYIQLSILRREVKQNEVDAVVSELHRILGSVPEEKTATRGLIQSIANQISVQTKLIRGEKYKVTESFEFQYMYERGKYATIMLNPNDTILIGQNSNNGVSFSLNGTPDLIRMSTEKAFELKVEKIS